MSEQDLQLLHKKLDYLTTQIDAQRQRQQVIDDLITDMMPAVNQLSMKTIEELDEIGSDVSLDEILSLFKRLLRDVELLNSLLAQVESMSELAQDFGPMIQPMSLHLIMLLEQMTQKGYFQFANGAVYVMEQIVSEFDESDVRALGDNVVTILKTVRHMTQPEVMTVVDNALTHLDAPIDENVSTWQLLQDLRDPETRRGIARLLQIVKGLSKSTTDAEPIN